MMNWWDWWADFGGLLGRGTSWTSLDFVVLAIALPLSVTIAAWLGIKFMHWHSFHALRK